MTGDDFSAGDYLAEETAYDERRDARLDRRPPTCPECPDPGLCMAEGGCQANGLPL